MNKLAAYLSLLLFLALSACAGQLPAPVANTSTPDPDPCSTHNLPATVQQMNDLMREFDGESARISAESVQQLPEVISELQRIRRAAEDLSAPACLGTLRTHQLNHMNLMIQTLLAYVGSGHLQTLNTGLEIAQAEHEKYSLELVRLLGITLAPGAETPSGSSGTP
jgi:hypothetical protein